MCGKEIEGKYLNVCGLKEVDTICSKWERTLRSFPAVFGNLMHTRIFSLGNFLWMKFMSDGNCGFICSDI